MRREDFCRLTGEDPESLKSRKRRGLLPFDLPDGRYARIDYSGWRAVLFCAFKEIVSDRASALAISEIFRKYENLRRKESTRTLIGGVRGDYFVGYFVWSREGSDHFETLNGTLKHIQERLDNWNNVAAVEKLAQTGNSRKGPVSDIRLVNFSKMIREFNERAKSLGIDLNQEYLIDELSEGNHEDEA